jgi:hypothetical protein
MEGKFLYLKYFNRLNRVLNGIGRNSLLGPGEKEEERINVAK